MFTMMPEKPEDWMFSVTAFIMAMVWRRVSMRVWPLARSGRGPAATIIRGASAASA